MNTAAPYSRRDGWKRLLSLLLSAAFLLLPAFINGYPLVNSDDGTYLNSGFLPEMPGDRPIAYGLLLNIFSLHGLSLWIALAVQALVMAWLLHLVVARTVGGGPAQKLFVVAALSLATSLSWVTSHIVPDICTPMTLLAAWLLLNAEETPRLRLLLFGTYLAMVATHISHVMIFGLLIGGFFLFRRWLMPARTRAAAGRTTVWLAVLSTLALATMLKPIGASKHIFTMATLLDAGILKPYLDEACPTKGYTICKYKDNMDPNPDYFLWGDKSPAASEGGWKAVKPEYNRIVSDIHRQPKYVWMRVQASARATLRQIRTFHIGEGVTPFGEGSHVHAVVKRYAPRDERGYLDARQHHAERMPVEALQPVSRVFAVIVVLSAIALVAMLVLRGRRLPVTLRFFVFFALAGALLNFWNCATFSQVNGRYGARMMWLVPFCAVLCALALLRRKRNSLNAV